MYLRKIVFFVRCNNYYVVECVLVIRVLKMSSTHWKTDVGPENVKSSFKHIEYGIKYTPVSKDVLCIHFLMRT